MVDILQTTLSKVFSYMKKYRFGINIPKLCLWGGGGGGGV